jgi:hypothetical protein
MDVHLAKQSLGMKLFNNRSALDALLQTAMSAHLITQVNAESAVMILFLIQDMTQASVSLLMIPSIMMELARAFL